MDEKEIERTTAEVLSAFEVQAPPVDPYAIAKAEDIVLLSGDYDDCFDGRIELRPQGTERRFFVFLARERPWVRPATRVRFSLAHELGHYYLASHRALLLQGCSHSSRSGFVSDSALEREADVFATGLLMPDRWFTSEVRRHSRGVCSLRELIHMADTTFRASVTSTVRRYVTLDFEPCGMIISRGGRVLYTVVSESLVNLGLSYIRRQSHIPPSAHTAGLLRDSCASCDAIREGSIYSDVWFEDKRSRPLWEEAVQVGDRDSVLTFLILDED